MKTALAFALAFALSASIAANATPINERQGRQDARISHGADTGRLTACETARLDARGNRIERRVQAYRSTAGLQPWERADLHRRLNRTSADIHEQNHDGRGCW